MEGLSQVSGQIKMEIVDPGYAEVEQRTNSRCDGAELSVRPENAESRGSTGVAAQKKDLAALLNLSTEREGSGFRLDSGQVKTETTDLSTVIVGGPDKRRHVGDAETAVGQMKSESVAAAQLLANGGPGVLQNLAADKSGVFVDLEQLKEEDTEPDPVRVDERVDSQSVGGDNVAEVTCESSGATVVFGEVKKTFAVKPFSQNPTVRNDSRPIQATADMFVLNAENV
ncbi:zinc finger protein 135-like isoform X1 [Arapaima gigas]